MHYSLIRIKKLQIQEAEKQLEKATHPYVEVYLRRFIEALKSDTEPPKEEKLIATPSIALTLLLEKTLLTEFEVKIFGILLVNDALEVGQIARSMGLDRGKTYRSTTSLIEKDLVLRTPGTVARFSVMHPESPLLGLINITKNKHQTYIRDSKKILKFMTTKVE